MADEFKHIAIQKETKSNDRRTRKFNIPAPKRDNLRSHGQKLNAFFAQAKQTAEQQIPSSDGRRVLKLSYDGPLTFENLKSHGVEFISQEDKQLCIVFADEEGLATFADHLERLGVNDDDITYKNILEALNGIDNWTPADRESWAIQNKGLPNTETFKLDIELWPIKAANHPNRKIICDRFEKWLAEQNIQRIDKLNLDSLVMYRVQVTTEKVDLLLNHSDIRIVDLTPDTGISYQQLNRDINQIPQNLPPPDSNAAKICILDSGITTNHPLLAPAIAESASFVEGEDEFDENGHGTAVAGIALYGDLEACDSSNFWKPSLWIYNGKVLDKNANFDQNSIEKTLTEAVEYFVNLGCRIFNLSLGNQNAPYDGKHIRGISYVLDSLTRKCNALFIVSTGNFTGSEEPPVPRNSWRDEYPEYLLDKESIIIDPAPALNVLTVGAVARHNATLDELRYPEISQLSPAQENQPSPFTRHGPSVNGALKPDLMATGGNLASPIRQDNQQWQAEMRGLGVLTCNSKFSGNTLYKEICGTSFAAPYISHLAGRLLNEYPDASANLLRALLVNHANLLQESQSIFSKEEIQAYKKNNSNRDMTRDISGYGTVHEETLYRSGEDSVVLIAEDSIKNDCHQFFELPLPEDFLRSKKALRELRVTLAYSPPVRTTRLDYRATRLKFNLVKGSSIEEVEKHFDNRKKKEVATLDEATTQNRTITSEQRSKGTIQSSYWKLKQLSPKHKWFVVVTRQDYEWGKDICSEEEKYALVITATDRENETAQLYTQITQKLREKERIRNQA
ncbi:MULTISPECIES: S8 family peptidase [unclassified Neptuniibacter]|uniref:S8 family peptidase n=1 Tax=unclassified Neptuniibacter TaxID=2630693 RepID=UPI000C518860|nr:MULTISPECIES: S8 family peptidase [unclassified Neptuniibacter]MAY43453.1 peptidase S8 [Oceanospirillaceae bacterium]|tara:strand:+ start:1406 stop:3784 length:2379 start_codon:yes stop_codon:yes gene_type:complete